MLPNYSLNNLIDSCAGITLLHFSVSGLMCSRGSKNSCNSSNDESSCVSSTKTSCSMTNLNLGLSTMALTGALLVYRGLKK